MEFTISEENLNLTQTIVSNDYSITNDELVEDDEIINALELNQIREIVEAMSKFNQIEVLRILNTGGITINENRYGIHINLTELKPTIVCKIKAYINYVNTQEKQLHKIEQQKETFINTYFQKR
jgi:hypothetical protein